MKRLISILAILLAVVSMGKAQEKYLSITGGYTVPLSKFAESDINNSESGYADKGYNLSFEMSFYFNDYVGLGANMRFNNCKFNSAYFNDLLNQKYQGVYDTINLTSGNYNLQNFLIGPYIKLDIGEYFAIYGKTFIGVLSTFRPNQSLVYGLSGQDLTTKETIGKISAAFAYNFGAGVLFKMNGRLGFNISADYIAGKPEFDTYDFTTLETVKKKQQIAYFNYNAGLLLSF